VPEDKAIDGKDNQKGNNNAREELVRFHLLILDSA